MSDRRILVTYQLPDGREGGVHYEDGETIRASVTYSYGGTVYDIPLVDKRLAGTVAGEKFR